MAQARQLTVNDFRSLSNGSRGKTQLCKHRAKDRANVLVGSMDSINDRELKKLNEKLKHANTDKKREKILKSINYWNTTPEKFKINLESIHEKFKCK